MIAALALLFAVIGLVLTFSGSPDPVPYVGLALVVLGPVTAIAAMVRSVRPSTVVVFLLTLVPVGLFAWAIYWLTNHAR